MPKSFKRFMTSRGLHEYDIVDWLTAEYPVIIPQDAIEPSKLSRMLLF